MTSQSWQPIETAPKDGVEILLRDDVCKTHSLGRWGKTNVGYEAWWATADGHSVIETQSDFGIEYLEINPTHWMPLPEAPE